MQNGILFYRPTQDFPRFLPVFRNVEQSVNVKLQLFVNVRVDDSGHYRRTCSSWLVGFLVWGGVGRSGPLLKRIYARSVQVVHD